MRSVSSPGSDRLLITTAECISAWNFSCPSCDRSRYDIHCREGGLRVSLTFIFHAYWFNKSSSVMSHTAARAKAMIRFALNLPSMVSSPISRSLPLGGFLVISFPGHTNFLLIPDDQNSIIVSLAVKHYLHTQQRNKSRCNRLLQNHGRPMRTSSISPMKQEFSRIRTRPLPVTCGSSLRLSRMLQRSLSS